MAKYAWGDGNGKIHSIPKGTHDTHVKKGRKARIEAALNDPSLITNLLTPKALNKEAGNAADLEYGPQIHDFKTAIGEGNQRQTDISSWYKQYLDAVQGQRRPVTPPTLPTLPRRAEPVLTGDKTTDEAALSRHALDTAWAKMVQTQGQATHDQYQNQANQAPLLEAGSHMEQDRANAKLGEGLRAVLGQKGALLSTTLRARPARASATGFRLRKPSARRA
jgi:hypothetical protein